jgi:FlaA1/EpsC-like NDP-sugar epimerase
MGEPVPIRVLAEQMIRLAGKQPGKDIAITYTGLRPGEKLHETLFHADELYRPTSHSKILEARARDASGPRSITRGASPRRSASSWRPSTRSDCPSTAATPRT